MLRDRQVSLVAKLIALAFGVALTAMLLLLEIPLEGLLGLFLPFIGFAADVVVDGLEFLILPVLFAGLILPHLLPTSRRA